MCISQPLTVRRLFECDIYLSTMGLRSRDALARANSIVNERNARAGRVRRKTATTTTSASSASGNKATTESTTTESTTESTTGKRRGGMHGLLSHGRRKKIRWPDMDNSTREVTASGREVDVERRAEDEGPSSSTPNEGGHGEHISTKPRLRQSLETTIEYTPSASEDSTHDDALRAFNRLSSVGAGAYVRDYDDSSDEDSLSDEHDRAMRRAIHELEFANQGDSCSCCVVM